MTVHPSASFPDWLTHRAQSTPARVALIASGRSWTFAELDADATRIARRLAALGVGSGERVATLLRNGAAPALLVHAVLRLGATLVPLNTRLNAAEVAWLVDDAAPRMIVVEGRTAALLDSSSDARVVMWEDVVEGLAVGGSMIDGVPFDEAAGDGAMESSTVRSIGDGAGAAEAHIEIRGGAPTPTPLRVTDALPEPRLTHPADHPLAIIYTSGTTGRPKGAMLTTANFWWSAIGSALNLGTLADDRWLACLPLFHVGGLSIILRAAIYGITAVVHDGFDEHAVNHAIDDEQVTIVSVVAATLQRMLAVRASRPYPPTLRCVLLGGGPAPRPLLERCAALRVPVVQTYGLTETTSQLATLAPHDALRKLGSAGKPLYPNEVRIAGAAADGAGEILARGPVVMAGYAGRPDDTARAIVDGWLHTGDVGRLDDEGFLYILDRRDDLIITGGENVYPAEVEAVLLAHPLVGEAGVVGVADERWGQRIVAVVRLAEEASPVTEEALRAHCRARLAAYKVPAEVRILATALPRTASGKLRRAALRELLSAR